MHSYCLKTVIYGIKRRLDAFYKISLSLIIPRNHFIKKKRGKRKKSTIYLDFIHKFTALKIICSKCVKCQSMAFFFFFKVFNKYFKNICCLCLYREKKKHTHKQIALNELVEVYVYLIVNSSVKRIIPNN